MDRHGYFFCFRNNSYKRDLNTTPIWPNCILVKMYLFLRLKKKTKNPAINIWQKKCAAQVENNLESLQSGLNIHHTWNTFHRLLSHSAWRVRVCLCAETLWEIKPVIWLCRVLSGWEYWGAVWTPSSLIVLFAGKEKKTSFSFSHVLKTKSTWDVSQHEQRVKRSDKRSLDRSATIALVSQNAGRTSGVFLSSVKQEPFCFQETLLTVKIMALDGFQN